MKLDSGSADDIVAVTLSVLGAMAISSISIGATAISSVGGNII